MQVFEAEKARWFKFRRALRREDQAVFDGIFRDARKHIAAMSYASSPVPMESILLAMLVEERKSGKALEERVKLLEEKTQPNPELLRSLPRAMRREGVLEEKTPPVVAK